MTLYELVNKIGEIGLQYPNVNELLINDVYKLSERKDSLFNVFAITQNQHRYDIDGVVTYSLTLFHISRVPTSNQEEEFRLQAQSEAITFLTQLIRALGNVFVISATSTIQPFRQRFAQECAGAYASVSIEVSESECDSFEFNTEGGQYDNCEA